MVTARFVETSPAKVPNPRARILVVEDDLNLLEGIQTVLELDHYAVVCAENGVQAVEVLRSSPLPDLIVSDIMMPQMDGIELLKAVRAVPEWVRIPFIFLTARGERQDIQRGKQLGVDDYLVKPFDAEDLVSTIRNKLRRWEDLQISYERSMEEMKKRILTILNHEFRTPLTYVVAYADMLEDAKQAEYNEEEMETFLQGVSTGAVRLRRLIENFIQLVEMETGDARKTYEMRRTAITDVRELIEDAYRELLSWRTVNQEVSIMVDPVQTFVADPAYLRTALVQLIDNAVKFSETDRAIVIGAHMVEDRVCLWVQDQGRGIDPSELKHIFETFYQINRKRFEDPGTGTGLSIVQKIVELHGGYAEVDSAPGMGSRFALYIPQLSRVTG
ncbi:MAG: hybrid sensor histidine kinase/response regulator [Anaerolineae bacterium]|nr:hybrid sensor histidine kinase/response regulator [Anaerolineae bacterium]NUQ04179.1 hybrid sensor histidine kinase/response regulator [Anaerolineae bacterium]